MSTTPPDAGPPAVPGTAERALFAGLIDNAAVFPPGLSPLPLAVREHQDRGEQWYSDLVGPLLVPASAAGDLVDQQRTARLPIGVIARPGTGMDVVTEALGLLADVDDIAVTGVEIGWTSRWAAALAWDLPLSVEVGRNVRRQRAALAELAEGQGEAVRLQAKLRTQATGELPVPTARELAGFIRSCIEADLSFKLTGGLHHAIACTTGEGEDQHGVLNVLAATHDALTGADVDDLAELLAVRDPQTLVGIVAALTDDEVSAVRSSFTAYGCCTVTDPIGELTDLGLVAPPATGRSA